MMSPWLSAEAVRAVVRRGDVRACGSKTPAPVTVLSLPFGWKDSGLHPVQYKG